MKRNLCGAAALLLVAAALICRPAAARAAEPVPLAGEWRFALDRADAGVREQWFLRELAGRITLPGVLQSQGFGDEVSTETPWVLSLYDRFWFLREDYKAYTRPGRVKVPFLSQPPRHYVGRRLRPRHGGRARRAGRRLHGPETSGRARRRARVPPRPHRHDRHRRRHGRRAPRAAAAPETAAREARASMNS